MIMLHRTRQLFVRQRTMLSNAIRGQLAEFGIIAPVGRLGFGRLLEICLRTIVSDFEMPVGRRS